MRMLIEPLCELGILAHFDRGQIVLIFKRIELHLFFCTKI